MVGQGQDDPSKVSAQLPVIGLPGQNASHVVVPIFPEGDPRNQGKAVPSGFPAITRSHLHLTVPATLLCPKNQ
jgi:hypothetical protein